MTNARLLRWYIEKSGYKRKFVAEKIGLTYQGYLYKENGKNEFNQSEIEGLCELLSIPLKDKERIFFAKKVDLQSTAT